MEFIVAMVIFGTLIILLILHEFRMDSIARDVRDLESKIREQEVYTGGLSPEVEGVIEGFCSMNDIPREEEERLKWLLEDEL